MDSEEKDEAIISVSRHKTYKFIQFNGNKDLDLYNIKELKEIFEEGNNAGVLEWVIDLSEINHIDSSGLAGLASQGLLLSKNSKKLFILNPNSGIKHLFEVSGFERIFCVIPDLNFLP